MKKLSIFLIISLYVGLSNIQAQAMENQKRLQKIGVIAGASAILYGLYNIFNNEEIVSEFGNQVVFELEDLNNDVVGDRVTIKNNEGINEVYMVTGRDPKKSNIVYAKKLIARICQKSQLPGYLSLVSGLTLTAFNLYKIFKNK